MSEEKPAKRDPKRKASVPAAPVTGDGLAEQIRRCVALPAAGVLPREFGAEGRVIDVLVSRLVLSAAQGDVEALRLVFEAIEGV
jgi:hypothetical protein